MRSWVRAALVVALLAGSAMVGAQTASGVEAEYVDASELEQGDCLAKLTSFGRGENASRVPCSTPHLSEYVGSVRSQLGDGDQRVQEASDICRRMWFAHPRPQRSDLRLQWAYDETSTEVFCQVYVTDPADRDAPVMVEGSAMAVDSRAGGQPSDADESAGPADEADTADAGDKVAGTVIGVVLYGTAGLLLLLFLGRMF